MSKKKNQINKKIKKEEKPEKKSKLNIHPETKHGVIVIVLFTLAVLFILSFNKAGGVLGNWLLVASDNIFGVCKWLVPLAFIAGAIIILRDIHKNVYLSTLLGVFLFILSFLGGIQILFPAAKSPYKAGWLGFIISWPFLKVI